MNVGLCIEQATQHRKDSLANFLLIVSRTETMTGGSYSCLVSVVYIHHVEYWKDNNEVVERGGFSPLREDPRGSAAWLGLRAISKAVI